jgi:MFS family permease
MSMLAATRYVLGIRTNVILIVASACGYYFLAGVQTFGVEFASKQYDIAPAVANLVLLAAGAGSLVGVLLGGAAGDYLLRRGVLNGRVLVAAVSAAAMTILFIPPIFMGAVVGALPYLLFAALALSAQNPPLDAARLDIMPPLLRGRAEAVRTFARTFAQALAPLLFGAVADYVFGGGRIGLQWTFVVMLAPLAASAVLLCRALSTYPRDVATASAATFSRSEEAAAERPSVGDEAVRGAGR